MKVRQEKHRSTGSLGINSTSPARREASREIVCDVLNTSSTAGNDMTATFQQVFMKIHRNQVHQLKEFFKKALMIYASHHEPAWSHHSFEANMPAFSSLSKENIEKHEKEQTRKMREDEEAQ